MFCFCELAAFFELQVEAVTEKDEAAEVTEPAAEEPATEEPAEVTEPAKEAEDDESRKENVQLSQGEWFCEKGAGDLTPRKLIDIRTPQFRAAGANFHFHGKLLKS